MNFYYAPIFSMGPACNICTCAIHHDQTVTNRNQLAALIEQANITRAQTAQYIAEETKRPCSWRTVQAWLADPELDSSRTCPDWAITNLSAHLKRLKIID
ncbi:hypothetical protein [Rhodoferax antarcticus]|uniref:hypothetical protein n=1 Tax=Rhodoferax antarcticus TaxID=81479 RepID=UPI001FD07811|nr:hypothetical protein [Rhodoferax antarcticus]